MTSREERTHVFIVRIRREPREIPGTAPQWRGMIEYVGKTEETTSRQGLNGLADIMPFIVARLREVGGFVDIRSRVRRWLRVDKW